MKYCSACGMPLKSEGDVRAETDKGPLCEYCVGPDGKVKSCKEIFEGGVNFFMGAVPGVDRDLAERVTRKNMNMQPQWEDSEDECLKGEEASDEEFQDVLKKLHEGQG